MVLGRERTIHVDYEPPKLTVFALALIFCCSTSSRSQSLEPKPDDSYNKRGLHATLNAQPGYYGDPRLVTLTFRLMNDSDRVLYSERASWILVIDGQEVPNRGGQLWIGTQTAGGYEIVGSGYTFQFGKGLPIREYFPETRDYKIYWKAAAFRSNIAVVRGGNTR
jgi:hypothetical protein